MRFYCLICFIHKHVLPITLFSSFPFFSICQDYDTKLELLNLSITGISYSGYQTELDFNPATVKLGLWKYTKHFGQLINNGTHYILKIPITNNDGNIELRLFLKLSGKNKTLVHMALDTAKIPIANLSVYQKETQNLILDFKKKFYWEQYQKVVDTKTAQAYKLSKKYRKISKKSANSKEGSRILENLLAINREIEKLKKLQLALST
tara:strand:+ start:938 stop:1558 length:621 start_codon:yes stop_codon:yes gene_type:complete